MSGEFAFSQQLRRENFPASIQAYVQRRLGRLTVITFEMIKSQAAHAA
jgi:hypothetical protein